MLRGTTAYARRDWGAALANLWIVVEQMTSHLWERNVLKEAKEAPFITGRMDSLADNRTWTVSVKHEVLFQRGVLSASAFTELNQARKARNKLSHSGLHPDEPSARAVLNSVMELFEVIFPNVGIPFLKLDLNDHGLSDPFQPRGKRSINPEYWMEIKKLPGEAELERLEAKARRADRDKPS